MNIKKKDVGLKMNIKKHDLLFNYNIRADTLLAIGYVDFIRIPCRCYECLSKLDSLWNIWQNNFNKVWYKGKNQHCVYCPILGYYNNWEIINYIDSRK